MSVSPGRYCDNAWIKNQGDWQISTWTFGIRATDEPVQEKKGDWQVPKVINEANSFGRRANKWERGWVVDKVENKKASAWQSVEFRERNERNHWGICWKNYSQQEY
jgi:hypothetical protein